MFPFCRNLGHFPSKEERRREHEQRITKQLDGVEIDLIVLSGYMRLLSPNFVEKYFPRIINIHPSLLPAFPGKDAHTDVLASGVRVSGCTVHVVDAGMDTGPILAQRRVPVFSTDTRSQLAKRVQLKNIDCTPKSLIRFVLVFNLIWGIEIFERSPSDPI